jgi:hypothetical protein
MLEVGFMNLEDGRVSRERADAMGVEGLAAMPARCPVPKVARRLGAAAVLFFLIKGLMWVVLPALVVWWHS